MEVLRNGKFSITLQSRDLARGLRKTNTVPRDVHSFTVMTGLVVKESIVQALSTLSRIDTSIITDAFPYPQLFVLSNHILICGQTKIYEYTGSMTLKHTASVAGSTWKVVDFIEYLLLTNDKVVVQRSAETGLYSEITSIPSASTICNYNGQVLIGGPNE